MDTPFLTIAEASEKTGRSASTIRRLIRTIAEAADHPDRPGIEPAPKAVEGFKKKGLNFTWKIRGDVLEKHLPGAPEKKEKSSSGTGSSVGADVLEILERELTLKNQQIEKQWDVINSLNERLREGNILMASLQQRLALPSPDAPAVTVTEEPSKDASTEALQRASKKKVSEVKEKLGMKDSAKASKKGFFAKLFG